jgi:heptosyltransferase-1
VHHLPAVSDAARKFPQAQMDWIVEEPFAAIAAMHPAVRRVIPVNLRRWRSAWWRGSTWSDLHAFRASVREERYDAIIDTQSLLKSALLCASALGVRHGMDRASAREPLAARFYDRRHSVARGLHAVERNRLLTAAALGYALDLPLHYGVEAPMGEESDEAPYAVFLSMTSRADKLWPEERWSELGRALGLRVVLPWGTDVERARAARIAATLAQAQVPRRMTIEQLARLFARAEVVVGADTGLTHLAAALGARTLGIYGGSDPALTGLYGAAQATNVGALGRSPEVAEVLHVLK